ncbi:uncharacterized protein LOC106876913 isoform X1 [Octopus bimaculoides]|uniref:PX domain-containing protein n=2 Tax=Octopus bimaculoides TaxID=37653 RepID=A0A0L8GGZ4_OCTBM|nr:uncharacterized protein LOC106876913 isoform X1 [Octopus bimaculoides]XP_052829801.1 uncharacterized protein LOC106876913 isoform X1 [Octopus bimaculoides]|eukprot:XP_014781148.1 PREDICTED: uncharacterized protein LOC106876913 [Octopus bimaculoides]
MEISVQNPRTIFENGRAKYVAYQLSLKNCFPVLPLDDTDHVWRSYREFHLLRNILRQRHKNLMIPSLQSECCLLNKFNLWVVMRRVSRLCAFAESCFKEKELTMDPTFRLFFQSDLSFEEILKFHHGHYAEDFIKNIWQTNGITRQLEQVEENNSIEENLISVGEAHHLLNK